jgi:hypothetical protein
MLGEIPHGQQMGAVGTQVALHALRIANIYEYILEYRYFAILAC